MAEGKNRAYKWETGDRAVISLAKKAYALLNNEADRNYPYTIKNLYVFGSYAKGKERIHDVDVAIEMLYKGEKAEKEYLVQYPAPDHYDFTLCFVKAENDTYRYLRDGLYIMSFHTVREIDALLEGNHESESKRYIVQNQKMTDYGMSLVGKPDRIKVQRRNTSSLKDVEFYLAIYDVPESILKVLQENEDAFLTPDSIEFVSKDGYKSSYSLDYCSFDEYRRGNTLGFEAGFNNTESLLSGREMITSELYSSCVTVNMVHSKSLSEEDIECLKKLNIVCIIRKANSNTQKFISKNVSLCYRTIDSDA